MESYALYINLAGLALLVIGCVWLIVRAFRHRRKAFAPLMLIGLGVAVTGFPPAYRLLVPIDLGPREKIVNGQRHITLTGWDRKDYALLRSRRDVVVLQMANPDVTDETLELLKGMNDLKELDLDNTRVTDTGLKVLKELPALSTLRLENTQVTDQGFKESLAAKESLQRLDLRGTRVSQETAQTWRQAKSGRQVMR
jgi:hypothetical protein